MLQQGWAIIKLVPHKHNQYSATNPQSGHTIADVHTMPNKSPTIKPSTHVPSGNRIIDRNNDSLAHFPDILENK